MPRTDAAAPALPRIAPMLLRAGRPPTGREHQWAVELKWDGMRLAFATDGTGGWCARSRPGRNCTDEFSELRALAEELAGRQVALDGELVVLGVDGRPDFAALRRRLVGSGRRRPVATSPVAAASPPLATYMVFDLLVLDGEPVHVLPYAQRRALLAELLADGPVWRVPDHWTGNLDDVVAVTREHQLEGVVFKRQDARYEPGRRSRAWLKLKHRRTETFAVTGWAPAQADSGELDTFFVARADARGRLRPAGGVQLGLGGDARAQLRAAVQASSSARRGRRAVRDVAAGITVDVSFHGSADGALRDPVLRGISFGERAV